ncbi:hypothetical protein Clacol_006112 [Clathrus columnatus]|uniref:Peptidase S53 domain-containing protein n=1 Tax=Clathrus columnatus TaxID=1419009 RepID=A0AAV5AGR2_9AGAM|nr:hypothetical protein Clacol_006112 [Clathrus columnatus]
MISTRYPSSAHCTEDTTRVLNESLALLLIFSLIYSSPLQEELIVHRQIQEIPDQFIHTGKANPNTPLTFRIKLASHNLTGLEKRLYETSDPTNQQYGIHLTKEQVDDHVRPHPNVTTAFNRWMSQHGITPTAITKAGHELTIQVSVAQANKIFNASFLEYNDTSSDRTIIRTTQYSVPRTVAEHVRYVYPTTQFSNPEIRQYRKKKTPASTGVIFSNTTTRRDPCDPNQVSIGCLMNLYSVPNNIETPKSPGKVGILSLGGAIQGKAVAAFMKASRTDIPLSGLQLEIMSLQGGDNLQTPTFSPIDNGESNLDAEMVLGLTPSSPTVGISDTAGDGFGSSFCILAEQDEPPEVLSVSYVGTEILWDRDQLMSICDCIMQLAVRGTTVVAGSGDDGVASGGRNCTLFNVGATDLSSGTETGAFFSGGGFSFIYPTPQYQIGAVQSYLEQLGSLEAGHYNVTGRGVPDISAIGEGVWFFNNGTGGIIDGTSISTPVVAAIISGLNLQRRANGKSSLGFVNPLIYAHPEVLNDITQGTTILELHIYM